MSERFYQERFDTPTGWFVVVTDAQQRLRAAEWEDKSHRLERALRLHYGEQGYELQVRHAKSAARLALEAYFQGEFAAVDAIRTQTAGTDFQRKVWAALREIPLGTTVSYGELAASIDRAAAVRAVGAANGANPIPIIVPCHRVIGADGSLTGFGGGVERKRWLLAHERTYSASRTPRNLELRV